jgi:hypothetical protein
MSPLEIVGAATLTVLAIVGLFYYFKFLSWLANR